MMIDEYRHDHDSPVTRTILYRAAVVGGHACRA
jgi:hypothetical protein